jgi:DNA repair ATPase RecN
MDIEEKLNRAIIKRQSNIELLDQRKKRLEEIKTETEEVLKSLSVCQEVAKEVQSQLSVKIETITNLGLQTLFGDEYTFKLEYVTARGKTEVEFNLYNKMGNQIDPMVQSGGGLVDAMTLCLRIAVYNISHVDNVIVFDEAMKFLSKGFREKAAELIHTLSERLGLQIIEVTHIPEFMENSDKQFVIKKINGVSNAEN